MNEQIKSYINSFDDIDQRINCINELRMAIHECSPFKNNPVDMVKWIKNNTVSWNDYNPNEVAPPEMELLEISIMNDWYTQPIVGWERDDWLCEIVDWFHRHRVWKESIVISNWLMGYLPIVNIRQEKQNKNDRIASTIRHNRARGKHKVDAMSEIVIELKNRNWTNDRIAKQLWMDDEEVLRLLQVSWLEDMFKDDDFSRAWISDDNITNDFIALTDDIDWEFIDWVRVVNVDDEDRIFHTYDKWECHKAWLYETKVEWKKQEELEQQFADFFRSEWLFEMVWDKLIKEWKYSCEQYLTNKCMNRIAWIWQSCVCYEYKIPKKYCWWWFLLTEEEKDYNDNIALDLINKRMIANWRDTLSMVEAKWWVDRQVNIY